MPLRTAIYPGSFDPITNGHTAIITRSLQVFDRVIVAVLKNASKQPLFNLDERVDMIRRTFKDETRLEVDSFQGLLIDYVQSKGAIAIIRGLRGVSDFEYELQMTNMNRRLAPDIITLFMMAEDRHFYVSSSLLKEVVRLGGDVTGLVPEHVEKQLLERFPDKQ